MDAKVLINGNPLKFNFRSHFLYDLNVPEIKQKENGIELIVTMNTNDVDKRIKKAIRQMKERNPQYKISYQLNA